jgi:hypothetical protein
VLEINRIPPQGDELDRPQPVAVGEQIMVASRWAWRLKPAAVISRATSASVRYSRARVSALRLLVACCGAHERSVRPQT